MGVPFQNISKRADACGEPEGIFKCQSRQGSAWKTLNEKPFSLDHAQHETNT